MKTSGGEYVAPQIVEGVPKAPLFVLILLNRSRLLWMHRKCVSALIAPVYEALEEYAQSMELKFESRMDLIRDQSIQALFQQRLESLQKELPRFEKVKKFTLLPRGFSLDLEEITPIFKEPLVKS